jgi:hypothetical protein
MEIIAAVIFVLICGCLLHFRSTNGLWQLRSEIDALKKEIQEMKNPTLLVVFLLLIVPAFSQTTPAPDAQIKNLQNRVELLERRVRALCIDTNSIACAAR